MRGVPSRGGVCILMGDVLPSEGGVCIKTAPSPGKDTTGYGQFLFD